MISPPSYIGRLMFLLMLLSFSNVATPIVAFTLAMIPHSSTSDNNFLNFGPATPEILMLIYIGGCVHTWPEYAVRWFLKVIR